MKEEFKHVKDFPRYMVSNTGRVLSTAGKKVRELKPQTDAIGYQHVRLYPDDHRFGSYGPKRGKRPKLFKVHRLVIETFFPEGETEDRREVNHKNGIKTDNRLENLEWVNRSENILHAYDTGLKTEGALATGRTKQKPVRALLPDGTEEYYLSRLHTALTYGTAPLVIVTAIKHGDPVRRGVCKGITFFDCPELPKGEDWKMIAGIEEKLMKYRAEYWGPEKRAKRREWYKKWKKNKK